MQVKSTSSKPRSLIAKSCLKQRLRGHRRRGSIFSKKTKPTQGSIRRKNEERGERLKLETESHLGPAIPTSHGVYPELEQVPKHRKENLYGQLEERNLLETRPNALTDPKKGVLEEWVSKGAPHFIYVGSCKVWTGWWWGTRFRTVASPRKKTIAVRVQRNMGD